MGSAFEVETQLFIAKKRNYVSEEVYLNCVKDLQSLERQLNTFITTLK